MAHEVAEELPLNGSSQQSITNFFYQREPVVKLLRTSSLKSLIVMKELEERELCDETGQEKEYQSLMFGLANIPLKNLLVSDHNGIEVNENRVARICASIKSRYDSSLSIPVVCPTEGNVITEIKDAKSQILLVFQKIHTVQAFKKMDEQGEFTLLKGHGNGTLPCFVLKKLSLNLTHYGNLRSNFIENDFTRKFKPQDLLSVFDSLSKKKSPEECLEAMERMGRLFRVGPNEMTAIRKLCKWKH